MIKQKKTFSDEPNKKKHDKPNYYFTAIFFLSKWFGLWAFLSK
jgi:hypothetical protein